MDPPPQTIVSSILLRPHVTETDATMLPQTSQIRAQVEEARVDLLRWIRKRWMGVRQEGGFDALEGWSIKEISQGATHYQKFIHFACSSIPFIHLIRIICN